MRSIWLLLGLCACGGASRSVVFPEYQPKVASESWCRLDSGVFAFEPRPQVSPPLLGTGCAAPHRDATPEDAPAGSTFAELVVEPGGSIAVPVELPKALQGAGCQIDSVLIPHGKRTSDLALEIASTGRVVPIVSYAQLPPPPEDGASPRTVVSDAAGKRRGIWAPEAAADKSPSEGSVTAIADPELWPTGAVLKFDGGRTADGAASVVFEIEKQPEPSADEPSKPDAPGTETPSGAPSPKAPPSPSSKSPPSPAPSGPSPSPAPFGPSPAPSPSPAPAPFGPSPAPSPAPAPFGPSPSPSPSRAPSGPSPSPSPAPAPAPSGPWPLPAPSPAVGAQAEPSTPEEDAASDSSTPTSPQPAPLTLIAYRHRIDIAAPDSFSIVLRARERAFGIGVRSDRESGSPRLLYRAPGAAEPTPTHLVPYVGVVVSRCGRPVEDVLRDIQ